MTTRVSVVMPVFNGERFIAEAIESVLESHFQDFELLVLLDAGTTDGSAAAATRAAGGDPRVRLIDHPHAAPSVARNVGLHAARGEFVANLDCDDAMFPDRLGRQVAYLDSHVFDGFATIHDRPETLRTTIRENVKLAECPSMGEPITSYAPTSAGAEDYRALADEIMQQEGGSHAEAANS